MLTNLALLLAQRDTFPDFPSSTGGPPPGSEAAGFGVLAGICCCYGFFFLIFAVVPLAGLWKVFVKAGQPGWAAIIPIYNVIVWMNIIGQPPVRVLFHLIPFVNIYFWFVDMLALLRCFGKDVGYLIGMFFLPFIFLPMLGFGSAQFTPPAGAGMGGGFSPPPGPRPGGPRPGGPPPQGPRPGGPQGGIRPGGPGGGPPRR